MDAPHFEIRTSAPPRGESRPALAARLMRTANCLTALLQGPTAEAGLNEARYNVLEALRESDAGCSQTELALKLLQSESNLSTLLERMTRDGLISRMRSDRDRRKSLVGLAEAGREALLLAATARARVADEALHVFDRDSEAALVAALERLLKRLESVLGIGGGRVRDFDLAHRCRHHSLRVAQAVEQRQVETNHSCIAEGQGRPS